MICHHGFDFTSQHDKLLVLLVLGQCYEHCFQQHKLGVITTIKHSYGKLHQILNTFNVHFIIHKNGFKEYIHEAQVHCVIIIQRNEMGKRGGGIH